MTTVSLFIERRDLKMFAEGKRVIAHESPTGYSNRPRLQINIGIDELETFEGEDGFSGFYAQRRTKS